MGEQTQEHRFVWPPRPVEVEAPPSPRHAPRPIRPADPTPAPLGLWRSIEQTWLGLATPPLAERLAAAGCVPDPPSAYCPRCGTTVGPHEAGPDGCPACRQRRLPWERMIRLGSYQGLLRQIIHEVKFTRWRRLGDQAGRLLGESLAAALAHNGIAPQRTVLVPVPASFRRRMSRGIDHAMVICRGVAVRTGVEILPMLRRRHGRSQLEVPFGERAGNVAGLIRPKRGLDLSQFTVVVVDDVTTTRATLMAACRAVLDSRKSLPGKDPGRPSRIWTAVLGVTPRPGGPRGPHPPIEAA